MLTQNVCLRLSRSQKPFSNTIKRIPKNLHRCQILLQRKERSKGHLVRGIPSPTQALYLYCKATKPKYIPASFSVFRGAEIIENFIRFSSVVGIQYTSICWHQGAFTDVSLHTITHILFLDPKMPSLKYGTSLVHHQLVDSLHRLPIRLLR